MRSSDISKIVLAILVIAIFSGAIYSQFFAQPKPKPEPNSPAYLDYGVLPSFTLPSIDGTNFTLSDTVGKIRLVTLIYTKCPDECPLVSKNMRDLMAAVEDAGFKDEVHFVTIDFDWKYDTIQNLTDFASIYKNPGDPWDFLLGSQNQTETIAQEWPGFDYTLISSPDNHSETLGPTVAYEHPLIVYVLDQIGHWRYNLHGTTWTTSEGMQVINYLHNENVTTPT